MKTYKSRCEALEKYIQGSLPGSVTVAKTQHAGKDAHEVFWRFEAVGEPDTALNTGTYDWLLKQWGVPRIGDVLVNRLIQFYTGTKDAIINADPVKAAAVQSRQARVRESRQQRQPVRPNDRR